MMNQNVFAILYVVGDDRSGLAEERIKQLTQQHALFALFRNQKSRACIAGTKSEAHGVRSIAEIDRTLAGNFCRIKRRGVRTAQSNLLREADPRRPQPLSAPMLSDK